MSSIIDPYIALISGSLSSAGDLVNAGFGSAMTASGTAWSDLLNVFGIATGSLGG